MKTYIVVFLVGCCSGIIIEYFWLFIRGKIKNE